MVSDTELMREALLMKDLHTVLNRACFMLADMSLTEYCLLCTVKEHPGGFPVKALRAQLSTVNTLDYYEEQLLSKELVLRVRDPRDHRALAFSITNKGERLVEHMDPELAITLLEFFPRATEAGFQKAAELMAAFGKQMDQDAECAQIFPAAVLKTLNAYRTIATTEASRMSLTFLHLGVLCLCGLSENAVALEDAARHMDIAVPVLEYGIGSLEERGLVTLTDEDRTIVMTEAGQKRLRAVLGRIAGRFAPIISVRHAEGSYAELKQYLLYLVG